MNAPRGEVAGPTRGGTRGRLRRFGPVVLAALGVVAAVSLYRAATSWPPRVAIPVARSTRPLAFSPDGATLATSDAEGVKFWGSADGRLRSRRDFPAELGRWMSRQPKAALTAQASAARQALRKIENAKTSELRQLWDEGKSAQWLADVKGLQARLAGK